jgi:hypothetical protein
MYVSFFKNHIIANVTKDNAQMSNQDNDSSSDNKSGGNTNKPKPNPVPTKDTTQWVEKDAIAPTKRDLRRPPNKGK